MQSVDFEKCIELHEPSLDEKEQFIKMNKKQFWEWRVKRMNQKCGKEIYHLVEIDNRMYIDCKENNNEKD